MYKIQITLHKIKHYYKIPLIIGHKFAIFKNYIKITKWHNYITFNLVYNFTCRRKFVRTLVLPYVEMNAEGYSLPLWLCNALTVKGTFRASYSLFSIEFKWFCILYVYAPCTCVKGSPHSNVSIFNIYTLSYTLYFTIRGFITLNTYYSSCISFLCLEPSGAKLPAFRESINYYSTNHRWWDEEVSILAHTTGNLGMWILVLVR